MIFLKDLKLIFIKAGRVGGSSFEVALSKFAKNEDIITPLHREEVRTMMGFSKPQNYKNTLLESFTVSKVLFLKHLLRINKPRKFYNHMSAAEIKKKIGKIIWDNSLKISIIRNPFDQLLSSYFRTLKKEFPKKFNFEEYYLSNPNLISFNKKHYEIEGELIIDYFIRYEHFEEDIKILEKKIPELKGLYEIFSKTYASPYPGSRPKNINIRKFYKDFPKIREMIEVQNAKYIKKFKYSL